MDGPRILIVKTSSLGDVVHNMPAVTDLRRHRPAAVIDWLVEEDYAPLARLHPAVDAVIPVAVRRWRRQMLRGGAVQEIRAFTSGLRQRRYDLVIDTQGLARSALLAGLARGARHGYDTGSVRERLASLFYGVRHRVPRGLHAIERNRLLMGLAAGYTPEGPPDYGLGNRAGFSPAQPPYAVLLHGSARVSKEWPVAHWIAVGRALQAAGHDVVLPWGSARERARSEEIAALLGAGTRIPEREPLDRVATMLAQSALVVGLDTGLLHLAAALSVPVVAIFTGSNPVLTGPIGSAPVAVVGRHGALPDPADVISAAHAARAPQRTG